MENGVVCKLYLQIGKGAMLTGNFSWCFIVSSSITMQQYLIACWPFVIINDY